MTEEEAIDILTNEVADIVVGNYCTHCKICENEDMECRYIKAIDTIIDLYNTQKEEIKELKLHIDLEDKANESLKRDIKSLLHIEPNDNFIRKDEVLKALGYEENDEEYKRIYNKEELILSLIRTINEECDRLEDIEDKKTMLEIHNIENQRDKYWKDKIKDILKKYEKKPLEYGIYFYKEIKKLLEE